MKLVKLLVPFESMRPKPCGFKAVFRDQMLKYTDVHHNFSIIKVLFPFQVSACGI